MKICDRFLTRVRFNKVGRTKKTWEVTLPDYTAEALVAEVSASGALLSGDIDCDIETGTVLVGGFRQVGTFERINP